jgi:hypothetical protein
MRQIALAALLSLAPMVGMAGDYVNKNEANVAIEGYDAVAYHTAGRPMQGDPSISHEWHDAIWLFASADNRALFMADPDRYAPQFGGFCSGAMSKGIVATIDPQEWVIVDGQLFLGGRPGAVDYVRTGQQERLADAAANYRALNPAD